MTKFRITYEGIFESGRYVYSGIVTLPCATTAEAGVLIQQAGGFTNEILNNNNQHLFIASGAIRQIDVMES